MPDTGVVGARIEEPGPVVDLGEEPAGGLALWRALGRGGEIRALFPPGGPRITAGRRPAAGPLVALVRDLADRHPMGALLAVCPQLAVVLPVLESAAADSAAAGRAWRAGLAGEGVTALGATDGGAAGSDLAGLTTSVALGDHEVRVRGEKRWVSAGLFADHALVLARHAPGPHFTNFTWLLVPLDAPGVVVTAVDTPFYPEAGLAHLCFDDVRLPRDMIVGRTGRGMAGFARHISTERFVSGIWASALCRRTLADTVRWSARRTLRGQPLLQHDHVRQQLARCAVDQRLLDVLCAQAETELDSPRAALSAMLLKVAAAGTLEQTLEVCARLYGADGFAADGVQSLRAAAAMFGIAGGATELLLDGIADHLPALVSEQDAR